MDVADVRHSMRPNKSGRGGNDCSAFLFSRATTVFIRSLSEGVSVSEITGSAIGVDPLERPSRMLSNQRILCRRQARKQSNHTRIWPGVSGKAGIPQCHAGVPHKTPPLGTLDRAPAEDFAEFLL
jgi:hypothetical protein